MAAFSSCCCFFLLDALLPDCETCALTVTILLVVAFATIVPVDVELTIGVVAAAAEAEPALWLVVLLIVVADELKVDGTELVKGGGGAEIVVAVGVDECEADVGRLELDGVSSDTPAPGPVADDDEELPTTLAIDEADDDRLLVWDIGVVVIFAVDVRVGVVC